MHEKSWKVDCVNILKNILGRATILAVLCPARAIAQHYDVAIVASQGASGGTPNIITYNKEMKAIECSSSFDLVGTITFTFTYNSDGTSFPPPSIAILHLGPRAEVDFTSSQGLNSVMASVDDGFSDTAVVGKIGSQPAIFSAKPDGTETPHGFS